MGRSDDTLHRVAGNIGLSPMARFSVGAGPLALLFLVLLVIMVGVTVRIGQVSPTQVGLLLNKLEFEAWTPDSFPPGFPRWSAREGMIRASSPCNSRVSGHIDRGIQWVTGENKHFVFSLTAGSNSGSTERRSRVTRVCSPFVNWTKHSV